MSRGRTAGRPAVLQVLVDTFNIMPIGTVEGDLAAMDPESLVAA